MRNETHITGNRVGYRIALITLDAHAAGPCDRASSALGAEFPGLSVEVHAAAEWGENPTALSAAKAAISSADIIVINLLFLEEHVQAIMPQLLERRDNCDAMIGVISDASIVKLTRMGSLDMSVPQSNVMTLLKRLRGSTKPSTETGQKKMRMLRRLPKILKYIPGKAQDLRAWFMVMQYWLAGSDDNVEAMLRFLLSRYCRIENWRGEEFTYHVSVSGNIFRNREERNPVGFYAFNLEGNEGIRRFRWDRVNEIVSLSE